MSQSCIAIVTDDPGWHGAKLRQAFADRGYSVRFVSLTRGRIQMAGGQLPVVFPEFDQSLPAGVFVRGVPGGSLEQIITYINLLHILERSGIKVYNPTRGIELSVDKAMASFLLYREGVATPPTWVTGERGQALAIGRKVFQRGDWLVSKPLFGAQGEGVALHRDLQSLAAVEPQGGIYYLQRYIFCQPIRDWRVFVVEGRALAAMNRYACGWLTNVAQGGRCERAELNDILRTLAEKAARILGLDYAGVDIIQDDQGHYWVLEVNGIPAWKGLQGVTEIDLTAHLVENFLEHCGEGGLSKQVV